jgi:hypothetical protein
MTVPVGAVRNLRVLGRRPRGAARADDPSAPTLVTAALAEAGELRMLISDLVELA